MSRDPHDPDLDRALHDAFASRHVPLVDRPSMLDVQRRARRRTQRRSAAMVGCTAVVALGGAGLWAARQSGNDKGTVTAGDGATPDATYCDVVVATTIGFIATTALPQYTVPGSTPPPTTALDTLPPSPTSTILENAEPAATTIDPGTIFTGPTIPAGWGEYTLQDGDTPAFVALKFGVSVDSLNFVNVNTPGYADFSVGLTVFVPLQPLAGSTTTTMPVNVGEPGGGVPATSVNCYPAAPTEWHCTGPLGTDAEGRDVYQACEPGAEGWGTTVVPTTIVVDGNVDTVVPLPTTTSIEPFVCPPAASCATEPTTSTIAIVGTTG